MRSTLLLLALLVAGCVGEPDVAVVPKAEQWCTPPEAMARFANSNAVPEAIHVRGVFIHNTNAPCFIAPMSGGYASYLPLHGDLEAHAGLEGKPIEAVVTLRIADKGISANVTSLRALASDEQWSELHKILKEKGSEQAESTVPSEAAPSASSDVR